MPEHIVRILSSHRASNGYCTTCSWQGPLRHDGVQASIDATAHAAETEEDQDQLAGGITVRSQGQRS